MKRIGSCGKKMIHQHTNFCSHYSTPVRRETRNCWRKKCGAQANDYIGERCLITGIRVPDNTIPYIVFALFTYYVLDIAFNVYFIGAHTRAPHNSRSHCHTEIVGSFFLCTWAQSVFAESSWPLSFYLYDINDIIKCTLSWKRGACSCSIMK